MATLNANPVLIQRSHKRATADRPPTIDEEEIFEAIRSINDPEHPLTLEALNVVGLDRIKLLDGGNRARVMFTPTIPHCSMATLIGLSIRVKLLRSMPRRLKIEVMVTPGTHQSADAVSRQINDKERVAAALENPALVGHVNRCLRGSDKKPEDRSTDGGGVQGKGTAPATAEYRAAVDRLMAAL